MSKEETLPVKSSQASQAALPAVIQKSRSLVPLSGAAIGSVCLYLIHFHFIAVVVGIIGFGGLAFRGIKRLFSSAENLTPTPQLQDQPALKELKRSLSKAQYLENVGAAVAERALSQFEQIIDRRGSFIKSLEMRFERSELTFDRYMGAADQVCTVVLDNLKTVSANLGNLSAMNLKQLKSDLAKSQESKALPDDSIQAMKERLSLGSKLEADTSALLTSNDSAVTGFDQVILAVSEIKTSKSGGSADLESVIQELQELAARAKKYSI